MQQTTSCLFGQALATAYLLSADVGESASGLSLGKVHLEMRPVQELLRWMSYDHQSRLPHLRNQSCSHAHTWSACRPPCRLPRRLHVSEPQLHCGVLVLFIAHGFWC